ncbi:MAG: Nramp family divalent metal transporter [Opitutaceae bacterium]
MNDGASPEPGGARGRLRAIGPGLLLAASGIGAGDVVVAAVTGMRFGFALLWAVVLTVALKFVVTEALARWQLATGETIARAWVTRLPRWVGVGFTAYLLFWSFMVGASLSSACGIAGASLAGFGTTAQWGAVHAVAAAALVAGNRYTGFQRVMKALVAVMALCVLGCAVLTAPSITALFRGLAVPVIPAGGAPQVLALLGGIGGSLTVICYGYWMRGEGWRGAERLGAVRADVRLAYVFTGLFGVALVVIAAGVEGRGGGARLALDVADRLGSVAGSWARMVFLLGFWCTVFTAMLGVWQGVPQVYADIADAWRGPRVEDDAAKVRRERAVRLGALGFLAGPPLVLLWHKEPVAVVVTFSITGAFVMPFLAATLLYLNNRREWMGALANGRVGNTALVLCLLAFGAVCVAELLKAAF